MDEAGDQVTQTSLNSSKQGRKLPFLVKAVFWDKPLFLLSFSLLMMLMSSPLVVLIVHAAKDGRLERARERLGLSIMLIPLSIPAIFLCIFIVAGLVILQRKLKTGSFVLSKDKLDANVARSLKPKSLWKRVTIAAIYGFLAIDQTYLAATNQHRPQARWGFAVFIWLVTIFFTIDAIRPFGRKKTLPVTTDGLQTPPGS